MAPVCRGFRWLSPLRQRKHGVRMAYALRESLREAAVCLVVVLSRNSLFLSRFLSVAVSAGYRPYDSVSMA